MKKIALALKFFFMASLLFADLEGDTAPVTVPVFYPYSDAFFFKPVPERFNNRTITKLFLF
jgi:hypothetical protein